MQKIAFSPPRIDKAIIDSVVSALESGWITTGPKTKALERAIVEMTDSKTCLCVNSATAGMELMLRWFGVGEGDEVIVPSFTYCSTANVVVHCGAKPVMVDVNPDDLCIDINEVSSKVNARTKAIIGVDLAGLPANTEALMTLVKQKADLFTPNGEVQRELGRMLLMTDAAHSLGAQYKGLAASKFSDVSVYSFHAVKNLTTAEGGAININLPDTIDADQVYKYLNTMSLHGQSKDALEKFGKGSWEYDVIDAGYKCNLPDVLSAIGLVEIGRYESDTLVKRKALFNRYLEQLAKENRIELPFMEDQERIGSYHLCLIRLKNAERKHRDTIIDKLSERGISTNVHYKPLPLLSAYSNRGYRIEDYPVSAQLFNSIISLPLFYNLSKEQVDYVCSNLKEVLDEVFG